MKIFEYYDNLHVYRPGVGAPGVQIIFRIFNLQPLCPFPSTISLQKTFYNFPIPCMDDLCRTCCKIAHCQPRVIIYIYIYVNFVEFLSLMNHAMFGNHRPSGSREEKNYRFVLFIAIFLFIGHVTWAIYINFHSPFLRMLHMKFV